MTPKRILLTGTHTTPALELITQLKNDPDFAWEIFYIGRRYNSSTSLAPSIESKVIPASGAKFYGILCGKFDRRWLPNTLRGLPHLLSGFINAYRLLKKIKPSVVVSFGGYVSVPVIFSAWLLRLPSVTHEQTSTLSLSTRLNSFFSDFTALSFPSPSLAKKYVYTGNLLRQEIFDDSSSFFRQKKYPLAKFPLIYITAGNQGSHHLNLTVKRALKKLTSKYTLIHQTGSKDFPRFRKLTSKFQHYYPFEFINSADIGWVFKNSQIIISRGGANTIQEIALLKKKSIIIPLPVSQQDEQLKNALWLKEILGQNTILIPDSELTPAKLLDSLIYLSSLPKSQPPLSFKSNLKLLKLLKKL